MLWDILQQQRINSNQNDISRANNKLNNISAKRDQTNKDVEELSLACQGMWELLRDHLGFTDDHLRAKILEIDARDGIVDGKMGTEIIHCPSCNQRTGTSTKSCLYCGKPVQQSHIMK